MGVTLTIILKAKRDSVGPSYQHNLAPLNSGIKVSLMWPFCMNPEVDSYRINAHNRTNSGTTYNIKLNIWLILIGYFTLTSEISQSFRASPNIYKAGTRPSVEPLYKNIQLQTMAQMYQLNISDLAQTSWHCLITKKKLMYRKEKPSNQPHLRELKLNKN